MALHATSVGSVDLDPARYDAVLFDMDGVVTDTARVHASAWKVTFDTYLEAVHDSRAPPDRPFDDADYRKYVDGKHRDDGVASFLKSRNLALPRGALGDAGGYQTVWALANLKNDEFQRALTRDGARAFPTTVALVHALRRHGVAVAIISASRNCGPVLAAAGVADLFPVRVDGVEMERLGLPGKPAPAVFLEAAQRLGVRPERAVVVEDATSGVEAGRAGRFALVIGIARTGDATALTASGADVVVSDLGDVHVVVAPPDIAHR